MCRRQCKLDLQRLPAETLMSEYAPGQFEITLAHRADALRAVTLGAAWTLKLDGEIGSIECGKRADFCVLEDDPTEVGAERLKDVRVWGTVQGGRVFPAA